MPVRLPCLHRGHLLLVHHCPGFPDRPVYECPKRHDTERMCVEVAVDSDEKLAVCRDCGLWEKPGVGRVGDKLLEVLQERKVSRPGCQKCAQWIDLMNHWGLTGCRLYRERILRHLGESSKSASWLDWFRMARGLYFSNASLLDEAMRRAAAEL